MRNLVAIDRSPFADEYPFESQWIDIRGNRMHYIDEGQGDVLLCLHGNPTWSFAWRRIIRDFSPTHRVIALDHIGCGMSDKPEDYPYTLERRISDVCRFIELLGLKKITLVAHDWGGAIGMGAAGRIPERFSRFILMNTGAFHSKEIPFRIAVCRIPILGAIGVRGLNLFSSMALKMAVAKQDSLTQAARAGYLAPYDSWATRLAVHEFVKDIPLRPSHPSYATLTEVEQGLSRFRKSPMLLIWGERDWCFTTNFLREFQRRFPEAETLSLPEAGHYVFEEAPAEITARMRKFLAETPI